MGAKGTGFTTYEEELDEEQLKAIQEMEDFQSQIENKESISLTEFSDYFRVKAALDNQPGLLDNKSSNEIYDLAKEQEHPLVDKVIKGGGIDPKDYIQPIFDNPFSDDPEDTFQFKMPISPQSAGTISQFARTVAHGDYRSTLDAIKSSIPFSDTINKFSKQLGFTPDYNRQSVDEKLLLASEYESNGRYEEADYLKLEANRIENILNKKMEDRSGDEDRFANILRQVKPGITDEEIAIQTYQRNQNEDKISLDILDNYINYKEATERFMENNPKVAAANQWHAGEKMTDTGVVRHVSNVVFSALTSKQFITIAQLASSMVAATPLIPKKYKRYAAAGGGLLGGYIMESQNYLFGEAESAEEDKIVSKEDYVNASNELLEDLKKDYPRPTYIEELDMTLSANQLHKMLMRQNYYEHPTAKGEIVQRGLDPLSALEVNLGGHLIYGAISSGIEMLSDMKVIKKALGEQSRASEALDNFWPYKTTRKISQRLEKEMRKIPEISTASSRLKRYGKYHGFQTLTQGFVEGVEEVLQGMTQSIVASGQDLDSWRAPEIKFFEHHGGLTQIRDEFIGGFGAGGVSSLTQQAKIISGINERNKNSSIAKLARTLEGTGYYVKKRSWRERMSGLSKYYIAARVTEKDTDTGKIISEEISNVADKIKLDDGSSMDLNFDNFSEAFNTVEILNKAESTSANKKKAWNLRDVNQGEVKVVQEKGKYYIDIYDNNGKLNERIQKSYLTKAEANKATIEYKQLLSNAKRLYEKYGGPKLKDDSVIVEEQTNREKKVKAQLSASGVVDTSTQEDFEMYRPGVAIGMFLGDDFSFSAHGIQEIKGDILENVKDLNRNPEVILDYLRKGGDYLFEGVVKNHKATEMIEEFDLTFKDTENYAKHRAELDRILKPLIKKFDTKERIPLTETQQENITEETPEITNEDLLIEDTSMEIPKADTGPLNIIADETPFSEEPVPEEIFSQEPIPEEIKSKSKGKSKTVRSIQDFSDKELSEELNKFKGKTDAISKGMVKKIKEEQSKRTKRKKITPGTTRSRKEMLKGLSESEVSDDKPKISNEEKAINKTKEVKSKLEPKLKMLKSKFKDTIEYEYVYNEEDASAGYITYDEGKGKIVINTAAKMEDLDTTPFHEFAHPFIRQMRVENQELFESILNDMYNTKKGKKLFEELQARDMYADLFIEDRNAFNEEFIVTLLEDAAGYHYNSQGTFFAAIRRIMDWVAEKLGLKVKGQTKDIEVRLLSPNTTFDELSKILGDKENRYNISINDYGFFGETTEMANESKNESEQANTLVSAKTFETESQAIRHGETNILVEEFSSLWYDVESVSDYEIKINKFFNYIERRFKKPYRIIYGKKLKEEIESMKDWHNSGRKVWMSVPGFTKDSNRLGATKEWNDYGDEPMGNPARIAAIKEDILSRIPSNLKDMPKEIKPSINAAAELIERVGDLVEFSYKITDELLDKNPEIEFNVDKLASNKKVIIGGKPEEVKVDTPSGRVKEKREARYEYKLLLDFAKYYKKEFNTDTGTGKKLSYEFKKFANKKVGLEFTRGHWTQLEHSVISYQELFTDISINDINNGNVEIYRMGGHLGKSVRLDKHMAHSMDNFNQELPLFWYAVLKDKEGNIVLHEYQGDAYKRDRKGKPKNLDIDGIDAFGDELFLEKRIYEEKPSGRSIPSLNRVIKQSLSSPVLIQQINNHAKWGVEPAIYNYLDVLDLTFNLKDHDISLTSMQFPLEDVLASGGVQSLNVILNSAIDDALKRNNYNDKDKSDYKKLNIILKELIEFSEKNINITIAETEDNEAVLKNSLNELNHLRNAAGLRNYGSFLQKYTTEALSRFLNNPNRQKRKDLYDFITWFEKTTDELREGAVGNYGIGFRLSDAQIMSQFEDSNNLFYQEIVRLIANDEKYTTTNKDAAITNIKTDDFAISKGISNFNVIYNSTGKAAYRHIHGRQIDQYSEEWADTLGESVINLLLSSNGKRKPVFWQDPNTPKFSHRYMQNAHKRIKKEAGSYKNKYLKEKNLHNKLDWHVDVFTGENGLDNYKKYIKATTSYYVHQRLRLSIIRTIMHNNLKEMIQDAPNMKDTKKLVIPEQVVNLKELKESLEEYNFAKKVKDLQNTYLPISIVHSLKLAYMTKNKDKDVFIHTGGGNTLLQGGDSSSQMYNTIEESKFTLLQNYLRGGELDYNLLYEAKTPDGKHLDEFIGVEMSLIDSIMNASRVKNFNGLSYVLGHAGLDAKLTKELDIINAWEIDDRQNSLEEQGSAGFYNFINNLTGEVKTYQTSTEIWEELAKERNEIQSKLKEASYNFDSKTAWEVGIKIIDFLENHIEGKDKIKEVFKKAVPGYFYSTLKKVTNPKGRKGPGMKGKGSNFGVTMELVFPENSLTPMWKINYVNPDLLVPRRYKKVKQAQENELSTPSNEEMLQIVTKKSIELKNLSERTEEKQFINNFFDSTFKNLVRISPKYKVDINSFQKYMIEIIPKDLYLVFEDWFDSNFEGISLKSLKNKRYTINDESRDNSYVLEEIVRNYDSMEETFDSILERGSTNEKEIGINHLLYFPALGQMINKADLKKIGRWAHQFEFYEWKNSKLSSVVPGIKNTSRKEVNRALLRYYNMLRSTVAINRDYKVLDSGQMVSAITQRWNWQVEIYSKYNEDTKKYEFSEPSIISIVSEENPNGRKNKEYDKTTIYEYNAKPGKKYIFEYISGGNVLSLQNKFDNSGKQVYIYNPETGGSRKAKELRSKYGFIKEDELKDVEKELRKVNRTIAFIRGDSDKLLVVEIKPEHIAIGKAPIESSGGAEIYWLATLGKIFGSDYTQSVEDRLLPDLLSGSDMDRASMIAINEAFKSVWPKYLLDSKGGANVYKRLKLPFTPSTISHSMPPIRVFKFDPNEVDFQWENNKPRPAMEYMFGKLTYILDGNSLTSKSLFDLYEKHHGYKGLKAKTVIYQLRGDNAVAIKHEHVAPRKGLKVLNKDGGILFEFKNDRNLFLGPAHPSYVEGKNNSVDMIATSDEIKILEANINEDTDELIIPGQSIGFTEYDEQSKNTTKHPMQWYNYVDNNAVLEYFRDVKVPEIHRKLSTAIYLTLNEGPKNAPDSILGFLEKIAGKNPEGYLPTALEHAKLGAGIHKSNNIYIDKVVQSLIVQDALNLGDTPGTVAKINIDPTNMIQRKEIHLSKQNSINVIKMIREKEDKKLTIPDINSWLQSNEIYVLVSRVPITNRGGVYMARVTRLHDRKGLADLNPFDVKEYLEADGDGDTVHIELLPEDGAKIFKNYLDDIKFIPYSLDDFATGRKYSITSTEKRFETMSSLMAGQTAIGEIATLAGVFGLITHNFKSMTFQDSKGFKVKLNIPKRTDKINFKQAIYKGKKGGWNGTIEDYIRIWLQAAADNNEYGLLYEWNYQEGGAKAIMKEILGSPDEVVFEQFWEEVYSHYKNMRTVRQGKDPKRGVYSFKDTLERSIDIKERTEKLLKALEHEKNNDMTSKHPLEYIATAPADVWQRIKNNFKLTGYEGSPFILSQNVHNNSHRSAVKFINENLNTIVKKKYEQDVELGVVDSNVKQWRDEQRVEAMKYVKLMTNEFYETIKKVGELGPQSMDRNDMLIDFKMKYNNQFKNMSNLSKGIATLMFIKGYSGFSKKGEGASARQPVAIPPVSMNKKEYSLLDAGIMKLFFKKYNEVATSPEMKKEFADKKTTGRMSDIVLDDVVRRVCK
ncbi:MAG: hypothetical protein CBC83_02195 [Flavobacteriales bacterium TMED123]|nr:MAG: hypothetical protein CBC83_02195 [Flavobacteriales bacterium TMED123]